MSNKLQPEERNYLIKRNNQIIHMYRSGETLGNLAETFSLKINEVERIVKKRIINNIKPLKLSELSPKKLDRVFEKIKALRLQGKTFLDIHKILGIPKDEIYEIACEYTSELPSPCKGCGVIMHLSLVNRPPKLFCTPCRIKRNIKITAKCIAERYRRDPEFRKKTIEIQRIRDAEYRRIKKENKNKP